MQQDDSDNGNAGKPEYEIANHNCLLVKLLLVKSSVTSAEKLSTAN